MINGVAVPPPEPQGLGLEGAVAEGGFGLGSLVGVKHEPEQLLVVCVGGEFGGACLFHLRPSLGYDFSVVIHGVFSAVAFQLLFCGVPEEHYGFGEFFFVKCAVGFEAVEEIDFVVA